MFTPLHNDIQCHSLLQTFLFQHVYSNDYSLRNSTVNSSKKSQTVKLYTHLYLHIGVQLEVTGLVAYSKVVLGHLRLGCVKGHLVASKPSFITNHSSSMNSGSSKVKVNVAAQVDIFAFVGCLDFSTLLASNINVRLTFCSMNWIEINVTNY